MKKEILGIAVILGVYFSINIKSEAEKLRDKALSDMNLNYVQQYHSLGCDHTEQECIGNATIEYYKKYDSPDSLNYRLNSHMVPAPCFIKLKQLREACDTAKATYREAREETLALPSSKYMLQALLN